MFLTPPEMFSAMRPYHMAGVAPDEKAIELAIAAAVEQAKSYLGGKYDVKTIFAAQGTDRNILVLEHCKSIAVWYLLRASNAEVLFDKAKQYYTSAVEWFEAAGGVGNKSLVANLPLLTKDGDVTAGFCSGSNPKFNHIF